MIETGTRTRQIPVHSRMPGGSETRSHTRDVGMMKNVTASCNSPETGGIYAGNGTFTAFAVNDVVLIEGANVNSGLFTVTGLDAANQSYLLLDPPPALEFATVMTIRTA